MSGAFWSPGDFPALARFSCRFCRQSTKSETSSIFDENKGTPFGIEKKRKSPVLLVGLFLVFRENAIEIRVFPEKSRFFFPALVAPRKNRNRRICKILNDFNGNPRPTNGSKKIPLSPRFFPKSIGFFQKTRKSQAKRTVNLRLFSIPKGVPLFSSKIAISPISIDFQKTWAQIRANPENLENPKMCPT